MARRLLIGVFALSLFAAFAVLVLSRAGAGVAGTRIAGMRAAETNAADAADERIRIQTHLARVSEHLRTHPPASLTLEQRAARHATLQWLDQAGRKAGAPLVDGLVVGATLGHLALLTSDGSGDHHASTAFNVFGAFVGVGTELVRLMGRSDAGDARQAGLSSHVAPGPNGMEVGLVLRH